MLARVGREIGPHLRRGQLVLSVLAGATTTALTGILGHDQVVRSMPNTPARLGKGMTVWYATPETTDAQRAQAAALLGALGAQLEVDDEKMVAMATAVSGTGPTYVFLVMEALIDAAVHLGFPRHMAHDLVIETLEGSTLFAKQSGHASGRAAQHGHVAGRDLRGRAPRTRIGPPADRALGGRLGRLPADRGAGRPTRADGPGASAGAGPRDAPEPSPERGPMTPVGPTVALDLRRAPLAALRGIDLRAAERDLWADEAALWDRLVASWAGLDDAAWHLPGAAPSDAGGPDWSLAEHVGHIAAWQELAVDYTATAIATGRWPSDDDYDGGDFDRFNERLREPWASQSRDETLARLAPRPPATRGGGRPAGAVGHPRRRRVGLGLHDPARALPGSPRGHRAVGRRAARPPGRRRPVRRRPPGRRPRGRSERRMPRPRPTSTPCCSSSRPTAGRPAR